MNEITEQRLHSRPNVSTLRSSVFIRGGLMLKLTANVYYRLLVQMFTSEMIPLLKVYVRIFQVCFS